MTLGSDLEIVTKCLQTDLTQLFRNSVHLCRYEHEKQYFVSIISFYTCHILMLHLRTDMNRICGQV